MKLSNYLQGEWVPHDGEGIPQYNAVTGELIATCGSEGLDYAAIAEYGRSVGGPGFWRRDTFDCRS